MDTQVQSTGDSTTRETAKLARFNGVCKGCGGEIAAAQTMIRWMRNQSGMYFHAECFGQSDPPKRDKFNRRVDGETEAIQPLTPTARKEVNDVPQVPAGMEALGALLGPAILPFVQDKIQAKVNSAEIQGIIESRIQACHLDAYTKLREELTVRVVVENRATGETTDLKDELQHKQLPRLISLLSKGLNVCMTGGVGCGKTTAAEQAARALKRKFSGISINQQSQPSLIMGYKTANGELIRTEFRECYEHGGFFLVDEVAGGNGNFLTSLNTGLANGYMAFPDGVVKKHPDFVCLAADNTVGLGATAQFNTRGKLDDAFRERFVFLDWKCDTTLERKAALAKNPHAAQWVNWVQGVRTTVTKLGLRLQASPRASITGAMLLADESYKPREVADLVLFKGIDSDTIEKVLTNNPLPETL